MTKEDKQILLRDLCARLFYGVKGRYCLYDSNGNLTDWGSEPEIVENIDLQKEKIWTDNTVQGYYLDEFKVYLRPMSSMTKEERLVYEQRFHDVGRSIDVIDADDVVPHIDWLLSHHFDFRGLIEKGLALEAEPEMYKI